MVLDNPYENSNDSEQKKELGEAAIIPRVISAVLDYFILSPIALFLATVFMRDGLRVLQEAQEPSISGPVLLHMIIASGIIFAVLQTIFILGYGGSPGQILMKLRLQILNPNFSSFLLIFFRQIGFVFSGLCLGLPWLSIMYHPRKLAFYEKISDTKVVSLVKPEKTTSTDIVSESERRYVGMAFSTAILFVMVLGLVEWRRSFFELLETPQIDVAIHHSQHARCPVLESKDSVARLQLLTAMKLVSFVSDDCLNVEVDAHLWKNFSNQSRLIESWSYLARAIVSASIPERNQYKELACADSSFESCRISKLLGDTNQFSALDLDFMSKSSVFRNVLLYHQGKAEVSSLDPWKNLPLVKKFVLTERIKKLVSSPKKMDRDIASGSTDSETSVESQESKNSKEQDELNSIVDAIKSLK